MLSDESSSDSETGRFKCKAKDDEQNRHSHKEDSRSTGRSRPSEKDRLHRDYERGRNNRDRYSRRSRERYRSDRHSPIRKRTSRERSLHRRSREREKPKHHIDSHTSLRLSSRPRDYRSKSRDKRGHSRTKAPRSPEYRRNIKEEMKRHLKEDDKIITTKENVDRKLKEKSPSPETIKQKKSEVYRPTTTTHRKQSKSPVEEHVSDGSIEVQPGSYYSMIPAVVKEKDAESEKEVTVVKDKSEESSEIDSSDDERLRAKLLNLEKELHKTRKKKHKKKHKKKNSKSKDKDRDSSTVEVTSTTDIEKPQGSNVQVETAEVTSTQKSNLQESSEEGEISSGEDSQVNYEIDPTDLRHKLKRSKDSSNKESSNVETCGPALPPHLQKKFEIKNKSPDKEGPALPPQLKKKHLGPSIPDHMREVLATQDLDEVKYVSSDDDGIGPLPEGAESKWSDAHKSLEERALHMKIRQMDGHSIDKSDIKSREQWMLELPEGKAKYLGLEARSFRAKAGPDMSDRSSWTDTPEEKARKAAGIAKEEDADVVLQRESRARQIATRDDEQEKAIRKHKKKHRRDESLLEQHQKKLKKKKKKEEKDDGGKPERRPFSRDVDLQVNRFDDAQKKSIIKKAQELNTRFSRGEAKYL